MILNIIYDFPASVFIKNFLPRKCHCICNPSGTNDEIRLFYSSFSLYGKRILTAHTNSKKCNMLISFTGKIFCKHSFTLGKRNTFLLHRSSYNHRNYTARKRSIDFFLKTAGFTGIFRNKILTFILPERCFIHFLRKRSLHGNQMFSLKAKFLTGFNHRRK